MTLHNELRLSSEEMRALGYRVVDLIVEHVETLPGKPVTQRSDRASLEAILREPCPEEGTDALVVLDRLRREVLDNIMHLDHPRFFAFVPGPSNFVGAMADALASGFNVFAGTWLEASGPTEIELVTIDWLRQAYGMPDTSGDCSSAGAPWPISRRLQWPGRCGWPIAWRGRSCTALTRPIRPSNAGFGCWALRLTSSMRFPATATTGWM